MKKHLWSKAKSSTGGAASNLGLPKNRKSRKRLGGAKGKGGKKLKY